MKWIVSRSLYALALSPGLLFAAEIDGTALSLAWSIPFVGILLSIALFPLFAGRIWHHHFGKITALWTLLFLIPFAVAFGLHDTVAVIVHALFAEYLPFIVLLFSLYTISGGILVGGNLHGSPRLNTALLAIGVALASLMGTTGAAMLMIRPLLRANDNRRHRVHVVVFFIFLVANIGGGLTPLGDPPLFLGFLKGVGFFWTVEHMLLPVLLSTLALLTLFYFVDRYFYAREDELLPSDPSPDSPLKLYGTVNFLLLGGVVGAVLLSGVWKPGAAFAVAGTPIELQNLMRDLLLVGLAGVSLTITPRQVRAGNDFDWGPILEVAKLFAGIFLTIVPVLAILRAGSEGGMAGLVAAVTHADGSPLDGMYFWMSGLLSGFLDNAPTYLVFFNLASGDAQVMMNDLPQTLLAVSMGSVFMGALSYIGNAPNFMVKAIADQRGVPMPSFFGYMGWSCAILLPWFVLLTLFFF
ncbi:sodium:proton antiporter [Azotobacter beijerinckii]|uniref:Transporter, UIT6 family n=1 Tax=Azotobacter beijerinckii TaxID=170623 RepID=A0A1I4FGW9_9GAMM|nr:sodium:proton antiporter [Azotobacter beijerinckii]SFB52319.1 transporter, UIT6 family [Azotobacter beijerinckii]SFL15701.1 transporter, UIT6 family [Azotobacter beijerinckii]